MEIVGFFEIFRMGFGFAISFLMIILNMTIEGVPLYAIFITIFIISKLFHFITLKERGNKNDK